MNVWGDSLSNILIYIPWPNYKKTIPTSWDGRILLSLNYADDHLKPHKSKYLNIHDSKAAWIVMEVEVFHSHD